MRACPLLSASLLVLLASTAPARAEDPPAAPPATSPAKDDKGADAKKGDKKKADAKKEEPAKADEAKPEEAKPGDVPPLPTATEPIPTEPPPPTPEPGLSPEEIAKLKAQLKAELETELKAQLQNEMDAAARDAAQQKAAAQEWEEEKWVEEVKPTLNFLEIDGYFRTRFDLFSQLDLGTFDPNAAGGIGRGTSSVPPPTMYRPFDGKDCVQSGDGATPNFPGDVCSTTKEDTQTLLTMNMRLRLDPTLNVSEDIRIRSTVDVFDNLVYGSTPESLPGFANNPTLPLPLFAASQNAPQSGLNSLYDAMRIKRLWAEVMTPLGQLRFGRMPTHFGLGLLANDGNKIDNDYGDNADQIMFATRIGGHYIVPTYSWSSSGPFGRAGGAGVGGDGGLSSYQGEAGQRFNLDPRDDVHSLILVVAKKDKEEDIAEQLRAGSLVLNYGLFSVYRTQQYDIPSYYTKPGGQAVTSNPVTSPEEYVRRDATAGIGSGWVRFQWDKLKVEAELVGLLAEVKGTSTASGSGYDAALRVVEDGAIVNRSLWIAQLGGAVESSYQLLNDQLTVGLDFGVASGDDAWGWGMRSVINQAPKPGDFDGKQYGECLARDPAVALIDTDGSTVDCTQVDDNITNFKFDPDYQVDLLLFREVLGTVTDAIYVKPHVGYSLTENLGARLDLIYSHAMNASSTTAVIEGSNPMGLEIDGTGYYGTEDGFYLMLQTGFLLPFTAFKHYTEVGDVDLTRFGDPKFAWTFQLWGGVQF
ncbi:MAG: hypothetical protein A2138_12930 [Deltaproteobacteria bacterium RBG_16_71_12]|nr:MAG: hypothetical protein A2138_12930 [Deltaproteobacteria bacterium RBG_16_71_12]